MDFWNKRKVRELELRLESRDSEIEKLEAENDKLRKKISGERVCSRICSECEHCITVDGVTLYQWGNPCTTNIYECELDIKCKDFKRKD